MQGIINHCIHPDIAVRSVMVDLKPVRAFLARQRPAMTIDQLVERLTI